MARSRTGGLPASDPRTFSMRGGGGSVTPGKNATGRGRPKPATTTTSNTQTNTGGGSGGTAGGSQQGLFNFQSLMNNFYNWKPKDDDIAGQQLKNTFQGDFIQTVLNNQMSKDLAYTNAEIASGQMNQAAALELANQTAIMADEHKYGQIKMGAEYDYQSKFATDQANLRLNEMSHGADLQQNQTKLEGEQNRLNLQQQGVNDMNLQDKKNKGALEQIDAQGNVEKQLQNIKGDQALDQLKQAGVNDQALQELKNSGVLDQIMQQGDIDEALQSLKNSGQLDQIGAQGLEALKQIKAQGTLDESLQKIKGDQAVKQITTQGGVDVTKITSQGNIDQKLQDTKGKQALAQIGAQGGADIKKIEAQGFLDQQMQEIVGKQAMAQIGAQGNVDVSKIKETGNQERLGMQQATKEDTKKQKRDSGMARSLAGMF